MSSKQVSVLMLSILLTGCDPGTRNPEQYDHCPEGGKTLAEFKAATRFPFATDSKRKEQLIRNYPKVSLASTKEEVLRLLGEPDFRQQLHSGFGNPPEIFGCLWSWQVSIASTLESAPTDQSIDIRFEPDGRMSWAVPRNISGLKRLDATK